mmetsp:Transcript_1100/g.4265  ORF Transcript_1100/g.4265 Transcript_1100/m.4265 type:complete len:140 (+) Transcript_1100:488-907(+)
MPTFHAHAWLPAAGRFAVFQSVLRNDRTGGPTPIPASDCNRTASAACADCTADMSFRHPRDPVTFGIADSQKRSVVSNAPCGRGRTGQNKGTVQDNNASLPQGMRVCPVRACLRVLPLISDHVQGRFPDVAAPSLEPFL